MVHCYAPAPIQPRTVNGGMSIPLTKGFNVKRYENIGSDHYASFFQRATPIHSKVMTIDLGPFNETSASDGSFVNISEPIGRIPHSQVIHIQGHLSPNSANRQIAGDFKVVPPNQLDFDLTGSFCTT